MKISKLVLLSFAFSAFILLISFSACKKTDVGPSIFGTWSYDSRSGNYIYRMSYKFSGDSTLIYTTTVLDTTKKQLGYRYKMIGRYRLNGSALSIFQSSASSLQNAPANVIYTDEQNLTPLVVIAAEQKLTVNFSADKSSFMLIYPPCGPNESCLGSTGPYIKQ